MCSNTSFRLFIVMIPIQINIPKERPDIVKQHPEVLWDPEYLDEIDHWPELHIVFHHIPKLAHR